MHSLVYSRGRYWYTQNTKERDREKDRKEKERRREREREIESSQLNKWKEDKENE